MIFFVRESPYLSDKGVKHGPQIALLNQIADIKRPFEKLLSLVFSLLKMLLLDYLQTLADCHCDNGTPILATQTHWHMSKQYELEAHVPQMSVSRDKSLQQRETRLYNGSVVSFRLFLFLFLSALKLLPFHCPPTFSMPKKKLLALESLYDFFFEKVLPSSLRTLTSM